MAFEPEDTGIKGIDYMLQDIEPYQFNNEFKDKSPKSDDYILIFRGEELLLENQAGEIKFPKFEHLKKLFPEIEESLIYLFSVDKSAFYYSPKVYKETADLHYMSVQNIRETLPNWMAFVAATAGHLAQWYESNRYCGKCAKPMTQSKTERALCCKPCEIIKYPKICPAIIVGIIDKDKDKILLTRYADRPYKKLGLVAGFMEIGETLETTVKREVMEEVGLRVKNIKYFKSQPWPFSQSILVGFFAELDGSPEVNIDSKELSEAIWHSREEIPLFDSYLSLTNEMIETFREDNLSVI